MSESSLHLLARKVLAGFSMIPLAASVQDLGNRGGFSGARLLRVRGTGADYLLKAWPAHDISAERLSWIHQLMRMARHAGLTFIPEVLENDDNRSHVECDGRFWDLTGWMSGTADFHEQPAAGRLENACIALAQIHAAWSQVARATAPCPGIQRRLKRVGEWNSLVRSGWQPPFGRPGAEPLRTSAEKAWRLLLRWTELVPQQLAPWVGRPLPLQPCLCDIWHDHILYSGDKVTGIIDYGGVKVDHVAVDLARLLGSMAEDNMELRAAGMDAYARLRPLSLEEQELITVLDKTGTIIGLGNWLRWLYHDGKEFEDHAIVARRIQKLVERIEKWSSF